jgi:hypothetical protein
MWETVVSVALAAAIMTSLVNVASRINDLRELRRVDHLGPTLTDGSGPLFSISSHPSPVKS